jgi:hypothetical protein
MGPIGWLETTVANYRYTVRDIAAERSHLYLDGSLKSRTENKLLRALRSASGCIGDNASQDLWERNGQTEVDKTDRKSLRGDT